MVRFFQLYFSIIIIIIIIDGLLDLFHRVNGPFVFKHVNETYSENGNLFPTSDKVPPLIDSANKSFVVYNSLFFICLQAAANTFIGLVEGKKVSLFFFFFTYSIYLYSFHHKTYETLQARQKKKKNDRL